MRIARCMIKATDTYSEYVLQIHTAFPWQQWLRERASVCTYIVRLVLKLHAES